MSPISSERVQFCNERLRVLKAMYFELSRQRQLFDADVTDIQRAMDSIRCERLMLSLESEIISKALAARDAAIQERAVNGQG